MWLEGRPGEAQEELEASVGVPPGSQGAEGVLQVLSLVWN